jgi:hypothetical protein
MGQVMGQVRVEPVGDVNEWWTCGNVGVGGCRCGVGGWRGRGRSVPLWGVQPGSRNHRQGTELNLGAGKGARGGGVSMPSRQGCWVCVNVGVFGALHCCRGPTRKQEAYGSAGGGYQQGGGVFQSVVWISREGVGGWEVGVGGGVGGGGKPL